MNPETALSLEIARLARAIRFALVSLVLALSFFTIRVTLSLPAFGQIFRDILNGRPLPPLTVFVIHFYYGLVACACLIPMLAVGTLFSRRLVMSFYLLGVLSLLVVALFLFMHQALSAPFFTIIHLMQGG